jgi:anti-anti-sigma factor
MTFAPTRALLEDDMTSLSGTFEVVVARTEARTVASVRGEVDVWTAPILRAALTEACALDERDGVSAPLTVDLANMTFIDACGLGVLVGAAGRARRAGRELVLRGPSRATLRVLEITRLLEVFTIDCDRPALDRLPLTSSAR